MPKKIKAPEKKLIYGWTDELSLKVAIIGEHYLKSGVNVSPSQKTQKVSDAAVIRQLIDEKYAAIQEGGE